MNVKGNIVITTVLALMLGFVLWVAEAHIVAIISWPLVFGFQAGSWFNIGRTVAYRERRLERW
jgi:hypothetical protein